MVLGAGRGPLVSAAIRASHQAARKVKVYAVEKNPNAVVTYVTRQYCLSTELCKVFHLTPNTVFISE